MCIIWALHILICNTFYASDPPPFFWVQNEPYFNTYAVQQYMQSVLMSKFIHHVC